MALHLKRKRLSDPVYPSVERLAWLTGFGMTVVRAALQTLRKTGWITAVSGEKGGHGVTVSYCINLDMFKRFPARSQLQTPDRNPPPRDGLNRPSNEKNPPPRDAEATGIGQKNPPPRDGEQGKYEQGTNEQQKETVAKKKINTPISRKALDGPRVQSFQPEKLNGEEQTFCKDSGMPNSDALRSDIASRHCIVTLGPQFAKAKLQSAKNIARRERAAQKRANKDSIPTKGKLTCT